MQSMLAANTKCFMIKINPLINVKSLLSKPVRNN